MLNLNDLKKHCLTKTSIFKSSRGEVKLRQLTIAESEQVNIINKDEDKTILDVINFTLECSMIEPTWLSREEQKEMSNEGMQLAYEIFGEIQFIGKSEEERDQHNKKLGELLKIDDLNEEEKEKK